VGDRWTLLIIRELLIRGGCRYTDLKDGLPAIATNLLSDRLRELESAGLIRREDAPPPIATTLFHLTETGMELAPVLDAFFRWGLRFMAEPPQNEAFRPHWFAFSVWSLRDQDPDGPPVSIELRATSSPVAVDVAEGKLSMRVGSAPAPNLVLRREPRLTAEAANLGLEFCGDAGVLSRILPEVTAET
jgi:DNA-binding HxlR family transcriptional regulator